MFANTCAALILLTAIGVATAPGAESSFGQLVTGARELKRAGHLSESALTFETALIRRPDDPGVESEVAEVYDELGDAVEAARCYRIAIKGDPGLFWNHVRLAQELIKLGDLKGAKREFAVARVLPGGFAESYVREGYALLDEGDAAASKADFEAVLRRYPDSPVAYRHLGNFYQVSGRMDEAVRAFERSLDLLKAQGRSRGCDFAEATEQLAEALLSQGKNDAVKRLVRDELPHFSGGGPICRSDLSEALGISLGRAYETQRDWSAAERAYRTAADAGSSSATLSPRLLYLIVEPDVRLAALELKRGSTRRAQRWLNRAFTAQMRGGAAPLIAYDHNLDTLAEIAELYLAIGSRKQAERAFFLLESAKPEIGSEPKFHKIESEMNSAVNR